MQAVDTATADSYEEDDKDLAGYDFQPLPTLPEDEENVSLADILSLRDSGLSEQEAWAVCLECSLSMRSVAHAAIFQTLCITPDTLAFNTSGNVCFMEQLSDDPEGAFVPPEFDVTGNTFEAHIYSLGATLKAALEYVTEPEPEPRLSQDLEALLSQMQAEDPRDRPDLESIIALCEEKMLFTSSCRLCRSLSAIGRRVLSIESFGAFQDVTESGWSGRPTAGSTGPRKQPGGHAADPEGLPQHPAREAHGSPEQPATLSSKPLLSAPVRNGERLASLILDTQRPLGDLERSRLRKVQTFPRLLPDGAEAGTLCLTLTPTKNQPPKSEVFPPDPRKAFLDGKNGLSSYKSQPKSRLWPEREPELQQGGPGDTSRSGDRVSGALGWSPVEESAPSLSEDPRDAGPEPGTSSADEGTPDRAGEPASTAGEQGVSLQELLYQLGRPFKEYELWALSHACLTALRAHSEHPAYLCLDSVLVAEDGAVLFSPPPANGTYDTFFLAPEVAEQELVTEKASVYCVAAVLWTAAKFSIPRDHKLALPRRLKTLLLDMARRSAQERPCTAEAIKICSTYLLQRGMDSRRILAHLRASTGKVDQEEETIGLQNALSVVDLNPSAPSPQFIPGFVRVGGDTRLVAVRGPVPSQPPCCEGATVLPAAFTTTATHFQPIVLATDAGDARSAPAPELAGSLSHPRVLPPSLSALRDREGDGKQAPEAHGATTSQKIPDQPVPAAGPQGAAAEPLRESVPRDAAQGVPCTPPPGPGGASPAVPESSTAAPLLKAQAPPVEQGPDQPAPPRTPVSSAAHHDPSHPAKPPRTKATEGTGRKPRGPSSAPWDPSLAKASPDSPKGTSVPEQDGLAPDSHPERPLPADHKLCLPGVDASALPKRTACPSLQEAMRLIQEEFAFDGYLDNGLEALIMGEYIYALKDLTYATFCGAISEKFCDLYWGEKLLQSLFKVVNGRMSPSENASEEAGPQPKGGTASTPSGCSLSSKRPSLHGAGKEKLTTARVSRAPCPSPALSDVDADELSRGNFEVGFRPQKSVRGEREQQQEAGEHGQQGGGPGPEAVAQLARPKKGAPAVHSGPAELQSCSPGWCSAFYEADCFGADVSSYVKELVRQRAGRATDTDAQSPELEQQLLIEKRNYRKTLKFYQKLLQKEKRSKGSEVKTMLSKLRGQLEEMKCKVQFLGLVKKYLQVMYAERWGLEPCALPVIVNISAAHCDTLDFSPLDESSSLIFYNVSKHPRGAKQRKARVLQAGTPLGLMAYLYSSDAFLEGYVQQFLYTFRYFCTPQDFLHFLLDRINSTLSRAHQDPTSTFTKIYKRSFCLLQAWLEDCYAVDFTRNTGLLGRLEDFISSKILPLDGSAEHLLGLLEVGTDRRAEGTSRGTDLEDPKGAEEDSRPLSALCKRLSEDGVSRKSFPWRLSRGNGLALPHHKERQYTIASALPKPCFFEDFYGPYAKANEKGPYFLTEYSTHQLFSQLTLLQQELFQKCHPVHFLNSRALGVMDKSVAIPKASSSESLSAKTCSLFLPNYVQDKYLLQLLRSADDVSTWVAAEIVTSHTSKLQVNLLSKFLLIAKSSYEQRNFATAMQILGGLEHLAVRQSPAWRILPAKIAEVMEELKAVEVFLKSDSLCLMEGRRFRAQPTLPSARLLAMHIQQLETGGFTMTNGAHRWSKLRNIAKVVSQVRAFQENPYTFAPDPKLQSYLKQRIARFSGADISILAADNRASFHQITSEKHSRKIQDKLRRMKATFQ
ncbi:LOW QUALITY PROTEIN: kinase non-catalytic C-lobe domain-containing protein 1 [Eumetopias jubatus]|uniref:LOW QUALITY PROTEIN: kinase non-catalytic C-lobe domain-containing protein 1 n=1 Tax=Eumetopias jubatus TaxID=34886 RepID=UPI001016A80E|nr:LOW QUALITY PROTEIN: kinase non-catalytic C-lobe domain-containing protein 1 [Eumetopias jubatus]